MADYTIQSYADGLGISEPDWLAVMVQDIFAVCEATPMFQSVTYTGKKLDWWREHSLGEDNADFVTADENVIAKANVSLHRMDAQYTPISAKSCEFAMYVGTANRIEQELSNVFSPAALKLEKCVKRVQRAFVRRAWRGPDIDDGENLFTSIPSLFAGEVPNPNIREEGALSGDPSQPQQTLEATPDVVHNIGFSLSDLDRMRFRVRTGAGLQAYVAQPREIVTLEQLQRNTASGLHLVELTVPGLSDVVRPQYAGVPFLRCDYIGLNEDAYGYGNDTSIYAFDFSSLESFKTIHYAPGALEIFEVGRTVPDQLSRYAQVVFNGNIIAMSLRSGVRLKHVQQAGTI